MRDRRQPREQSINPLVMTSPGDRGAVKEPGALAVTLEYLGAALMFSLWPLGTKHT